MLSEQDKREMLEDARNLQRREAFSQSRQRSLQPMSWQDYFQFLRSIQNIFPHTRSPHKTQGQVFKL